MDNTGWTNRARRITPTLGLPSLETLTEDAPFEPDPAEQVKAWWLNMGRLALMSLSVAALMGCGGGSAESPSNAAGVAGTILTRDSSGKPLAVDLTVIVVGNKGGGK